MAIIQRIDWSKAKTFFLADHTRTLEDVAKNCKANYTTVRARAAKEQWLQQRDKMATIVQQKATERLQSDQVDRATRCIEETITVARMVRGKVVAFLKTNLSPAELNAVMAAQDKSVAQERLALGMSTTSSELTGKDGSALIAPELTIIINGKPKK